MLEYIFKAFLLTSLIGTALTLLLIAIKPITRKFLSSKIHYYLWLIILVAMIVPFRFTEPVNQQLNENITIYSPIQEFSHSGVEEIVLEPDDNQLSIIESLKLYVDSKAHIASYMSAAEDGDEIIEALYEFAANCKGFVEVDEEITQQVTKEEFETVLAECEDKCALKTCIEDSHVLNVAEIPMYNQYREFGLRFKNDAINLLLPKIEINKNTKEYIAEELGLILYKVLTTKFDEDFIQHELYRYIPDAKREELRTKQLFVKYFYQVILYQERKPGIYTKFDDHMRRVIILEFYKRITTAYLDKNK